MRTITALLLISICLSGCGGDDGFGLSAEVREYLRLKNGGGTSKNGRMMGLANDGTNDGLRTKDNCPTITSTYNADGTKTTVYDYGNGCNTSIYDFINIQWGKEIHNYYAEFQGNNDSYSSYSRFIVEYENYGGYYEYKDNSYEWGQSGTYYSEDLVELNWEKPGYYRTYYRNDDMVEAIDGEEIHGKVEMRNEYDPEYLTTSLQKYGWTIGETSFQSELLEPLIGKYSCSGYEGLIDNYNSGVEYVKWQKEDSSGEFLIDYGKGACDRFAHIIENGKRILVDLNDPDRW